MLPELILDEEYELSEQVILDKINGYDFRGKTDDKSNGFEVCRIGGYRYVKNPDHSKRIVAWQCNMADIQNYDIKLPTIINICVSRKNMIEKIWLDKHFKGSQGIPCSYKYLNKRLQNFVGEEFNSDVGIIKDSLSTACRHTYELLFGACTFGEWCEENHIENGILSETTSAYQDNNEIVAIDRIRMNGKESITKIAVSDFKGRIYYNHYGSIEKCSDMKIESWEVTKTEEKEIGDIKLLNAENTSDFKVKLMKILSKYWIRSGKGIGVKKKFYFSQLWPTTLYGILAQMFAISIFSNSYAYFQHCIKGLQKNQEGCACIGVCDDIDECVRYFEDFTAEDLF